MNELPPLPAADDRSPIAADFLARWQAQLLSAQRHGGLQGAEGIRSDLELAPHQARTLLEVLSAPRIRHVLADEVGMGKTIEALMVYAALRAEHGRLWTMVLVPGHLSYQWLGEIYLRAHRVFAIATAGRVEALDLAQDLLLDREWIAATESARSRLLAGFGGAADAERPRLLIVDEAHRLAPEAYSLVQELARHVEHVLLLTATPVELDARKGGDQLRYEELLRLLDPDLTERGFEELRSREAAVVRGFAASKLGDDEKDLEAARGLAAWRVLRHRRADAPRIFKRRVLEKHVVPPLEGHVEAAEATRKALNAWAAAVPAEAGKEPFLSHARFAWEASISAERAALVLDEAVIAAGSLGGEAERALAPARERLEKVAASGPDPKVEKLVELIARAWKEDRQAGRKTLRKFLVFVSHRSTLERVAKALEDALATDVAVFHEGLDNTLRQDGDPPPRLQQLLDFRNKPATAILVCEDLAAEGHNLHSACHTVVLYDLPRNPNTTEQRIGRVDRLGQSKDVVIHVLVLDGTAGVAQAEKQASLGVFERSLGALTPSEEEALARGETLPARQDLTSPLRAFRNRRSSELEDRIRASLDAPHGWVFRASRRFEEWYGEGVLAQQCLGSVLTRAIARAYDLKAEKNEEPPPRVRESLRFRLARGESKIPGYRDTWGTCDRDEALEQDQLQFFAAGHPFVEDVLARATTGDHGARQALRLRIPGRGPRKGLLAHFLWDPARAFASRPASAAKDYGGRLARAVLPSLSIPVVVSLSAARHLELEVGPPERESPGLLRAVLQALVELDPSHCESALADPFAAEEAAPWLERAREAALGHAKARLRDFPGTLGRRLLARSRMEIDRDTALRDREAYIEAALAVSELARGRVADGLVLDAVATFDVR